MSKDSHEQSDPRPDVAKDDDAPRGARKDHWKNAEETMSEPPAGSPSAQEQSRKS